MRYVPAKDRERRKDKVQSENVEVNLKTNIKNNGGMSSFLMKTKSPCWSCFSWGIKYQMESELKVRMDGLYEILGLEHYMNLTFDEKFWKQLQENLATICKQLTRTVGLCYYNHFSCFSSKRTNNACKREELNEILLYYINQIINQSTQLMESETLNETSLNKPYQVLKVIKKRKIVHKTLKLKQNKNLAKWILGCWGE